MSKTCLGTLNLTMPIIFATAFVSAHLEMVSYWIEKGILRIVLILPAKDLCSWVVHKEDDADLHQKVNHGQLVHLLGQIVLPAHGLDALIGSSTE